MQGRVIASKLRLDARLGTGAMGEVWRARHLGLDKDVAVKFLRPDKGPSPDMTRRFIREARTACRLDHPNSIAILDFGADADGALYLAMELVEGKNLAQILHERGRLPLTEASNVLLQVLAAIGAAHDEGILHRDVKPSNILVLEGLDDDRKPITRVKVCDFGLAKYAGSNDTLEVSERRLVGTPLYMSPEQATGDEVDGRSDLYACGVVLFEALTGRPPYEADRAVQVLMKHCAAPIPHARDLVPELVDRVDEVLAQALAKNPEDRFPTARAFRAELSQLVPGAGPTTNPGPASGRHRSAVATDYFLAARPSEEAAPPEVAIEAPDPTPPSPREDVRFEAPIEAGPAPDPTLDLRVESEPEGTSDLSTLMPSMRSAGPGPRAAPVDSRFLWERYALSPHRPTPPRGFWLLDAENNRVGPLTFDELAVALRLEAHDGGLERCLVAADPKPNGWRPATALLRTLHSEPVAKLRPPPASSSTTYRGDLEPVAIPSLLLRCSESEMTGRVVLSCSDSARPAYFEVHVIAGHPTHIETNELKLQLPSVLVARGALDEHELPLLVSDAWARDSGFESAARSLAGLELQEHEGSVMRRRLRALLQMQRGAWVLDAGFEPEHRRQFAPSFGSILPRLISESVSSETLEQVLVPHLGSSLRGVPELEEQVAQLGFTSDERTIARELMSSPKLGVALPTTPELWRAYASVAYMLLAISAPLSATLEQAQPAL